MAAAASLLMAGTSLASGMMEASSARNQGKFERQQAEFNARLADIKAEDAISRGDKEAKRFKKEGEQFKGSQLAAMAAQGVDINSASFAAIKQDTETGVAFDEMEIRNNAWKDAWGLKSEAANLRTQGKFAEQAGKERARTSLLTSGLAAIGHGADAYSKWKPSPKSGSKQTSVASPTTSRVSGNQPMRNIP